MGNKIRAFLIFTMLECPFVLFVHWSYLYVLTFNYFGSIGIQLAPSPGRTADRPVRLKQIPGCGLCWCSPDNPKRKSRYAGWRTWAQEISQKKRIPPWDNLPWNNLDPYYGKTRGTFRILNRFPKQYGCPLWFYLTEIGKLNRKTAPPLGWAVFRLSFPISVK